MMMVVLAVSGLAVDGTRAFLERRSLQNAADAAALAAADQVDETTFYVDGGEVRLDPDEARRIAGEWLRRSPDPISGSITIDGSTVEVALRSRVETQFLRLVGIDAIPVTARAHAEPEVGAVP
jgi:hypothetical protein